MTDEMRTIIRESAARITETCGGEELFHARGCALPEHAEVLEPPALRREIAEMLKKMCARYQS